MFSNYFRVINLIVEFNVLSKSGLGIKIGQLCAEIQLLSHRKTSKIATSRKNRKNIWVFAGFAIRKYLYLGT
jgi:hypothetical protein